MRIGGIRRRAFETVGQTAAEYLGLLLVVAALIGGLVTSQVGSALATGTRDAVCSIAGKACGDARGGPGASARSARGPRPGEAGGRPGVGPARKGADPAIPGPVADPPQPAEGDGAGEFDSEGDGIRDRLRERKFRAVARAADVIGLNNAARHMRHYLDGSGDDLDVSPEQVMRDMPEFRDQVQSLVDRRSSAAAREALAAYDGQPLALTFTSPWQLFSYDSAMDKDWYYAMGAFSYSVTGTVRVTPPDSPGGEPKVTVEYRTHVFDRYNWDKGKSVEIAGIEVKDEELASLHRKGLAREYVIRGSTDTTSFDFDPDGPPAGQAPEPPTGGDRDGNRSDPGRKGPR